MTFITCCRLVRASFLLAGSIVLLTSGALSAQTPPAANAAAPESITKSMDTTQSTELARPETLARKLANPLSDMISVPFQFNWIQGVGPDEGTRQVTNIQPVVPLSVSSRWNVITRVVMPFISQPEALGSAAGAGDAVVSGFLSLKSGAHGVTWGAGPVVSVPMTTNPMLGSGRWSAGPTAIVMKLQGHLMYGALANQLWSFADRGSATHSDVSQMLVQPVISYITGSGITLTVLSEMTANWNAVNDSDRWTIPVTVMMSKIQRIGVLPVSLQAGGGYYLTSPEGGPSWQLRTAVIVILPKRR